MFKFDNSSPYSHRTSHALLDFLKGREWVKGRDGNQLRWFCKSAYYLQGFQCDYDVYQARIKQMKNWIK